MKVVSFFLAVMLVISGCAAVTEVTSDPPGAAISLNEEYKGETPLKVPVPELLVPGSTVYTFRAEKKGYRPQYKSITKEITQAAQLIIPKSMHFVLVKDDSNKAASTSGAPSPQYTKPTQVRYLSDVDKNIPKGASRNKYDIAVIIGNRTYETTGAPNVDFADRDAHTMKEYVVQTLGFEPGNVIFAQDVTLTKFNEIFGTDQDFKGKLFKWVKPTQSRIFIYYVGHGAPDIDNGDAYIVPVDANPQYLKTSGYRLQTLYNNLEKLNAEGVTIVIDACFSGSSAGGTLFKGTSALVRVSKTQVKKKSGMLVLTSSSNEQVSSWYPEKQHSLFTYFLFKGLQGDSDGDHDGRITLKELRAYLAENVPYMARRLTGNEQTPQIDGNENEVFAIIKK